MTPDLRERVLRLLEAAERYLEADDYHPRCTQCGSEWPAGKIVDGVWTQVSPLHKPDCELAAVITELRRPEDAIEASLRTHRLMLGIDAPANNPRIGPAWKVPPPEGGCGEPLLLDCDRCGGQMRLVHGEFCLCPSTGTPLYVQSHRCRCPWHPILVQETKP